DPRRDRPPGGFRDAQWIRPVLDLFKPGDVLTPAMFLVQRWVNEHLKESVSPQLLYDLDSGAQVLQILPHTLLSALWLRRAQARAGTKRHGPCKECGRWFEIWTEEDGRTARRLFCSDPCKSRDYRRRKEKARQLKSEGRAVRDIAKELDADVETI